MNPKHTNYEAAEDQNQGVISTMAKNNETNDTELVSTRVPRMDPNSMTNQSGAAIDDDDDEVLEDLTVDEDDETENVEETEVEEETDLTEHDHHQDDNYALGGHVTRSGGI
jgi:hypothetical protein